jgi:hypothetical protein
MIAPRREEIDQYILFYLCLIFGQMLFSGICFRLNGHGLILFISKLDIFIYITCIYNISLKSILPVYGKHTHDFIYSGFPLAVSLSPSPRPRSQALAIFWTGIECKVARNGKIIPFLGNPLNNAGICLPRDMFPTSIIPY